MFNFFNINETNLIYYYLAMLLFFLISSIGLSIYIYVIFYFFNFYIFSIICVIDLLLYWITYEYYVKYQQSKNRFFFG